MIYFTPTKLLYGMSILEREEQSTGQILIKKIKIQVKLIKRGGKWIMKVKRD